MPVNAHIWDKFLRGKERERKGSKEGGREEREGQKESGRGMEREGGQREREIVVIIIRITQKNKFRTCSCTCTLPHLANKEQGRN